MKILFTIILLCLASVSHSQTKLSDPDLNNLVKISQLYSSNINLRGEQLTQSLDSLKTPVLNQLIETLKVIGRGDSSLLQLKYLSRPDNQELRMWYVIREIHYNNVSKTKKKRPALEIAKEVLNGQIDERWLLDNYYSRLGDGFAMLFNDADLSKFNINMNEFGFKDHTEEVIFYLDMVDHLIGGRYKVLQMLKNNQRIIAFSDKLPLFNGKQYYEYTSLDIPDFKWIGYEKEESFNERRMGSLFNTLAIQFIAYTNSGDLKSAQQIYFNSLLFKPEYFKYSGDKESLIKLFEKRKNEKF